MRMTCENDGNCVVYRLDGVLLERCLVKNGHPQEHLIPVIKALRRMKPEFIEIEGLSIEGYRAAREIWDARQAAVVEGRGTS